jgi:hypothetical protein
MKKVDMSEDAILRRLRTVDRLRELCLYLRKAKKDSDGKSENEQQPFKAKPIQSINEKSQDHK